VVQKTGRKKINLALQGGGAYGAFTWGVLDHILQDGRLYIEGVRGASAGAINAIRVIQAAAKDVAPPMTDPPNAAKAET